MHRYVHRGHRLTLADLTKLRVPLAKTLPFIITADHVPKLVAQLPAARPQQLDLFAPPTT